MMKKKNSNKKDVCYGINNVSGNYYDFDIFYLLV